MDEILINHTDNLTGIAKIEIAEISDFDSIPEAIDGEIDETGIDFKTGKAWAEIQHTANTANYDVKQKESDLYITSLKFKVPRDDKDKALQLYRASSKHLLVRITDNNGVIILVGAIDNPCELNYTTSKPSGGSSFNGYDVEITNQSTEQPAYLV